MGKERIGKAEVDTSRWQVRTVLESLESDWCVKEDCKMDE